MVTRLSAGQTLVGRGFEGGRGEVQYPDLPRASIIRLIFSHANLLTGCCGPNCMGGWRMCLCPGVSTIQG